MDKQRFVAARNVVTLLGRGQCQDARADCLAHPFQQAAENVDWDVEAQAEFLQERLIGFGPVHQIGVRLVRQFRPRVLCKRGDDLSIFSLDQTSVKDVLR
jgi:hypothetical protein